MRPSRRIPMSVLLTALLAAPIAAGAASAPFPAAPPIPPAKPFTETLFGKTIIDPYRYFENMQNPVVQRFFKQENAYTRAVLSKLDGPRAKLLARIKQLDNASAGVTSVVRDGGMYFYLKENPGENSYKLYVRPVVGGGERVLVDPAKLASAGKHYTINYFLPSLDGARVAYGISEGGSEASVIHVVETATGRILPDAISRAYFLGVTSWLPGGKSFYYVRFPELKPGESPLLKETRAVNYLHVLGRDPDKDVPIFGYGIDKNIPFGPTDFPFVEYSPVSPYLLTAVVHGVQNEQTIYALKSPPVTAAGAPWQKVVSDDDDVTGFDVKGSTLYVLTHKNAPSYKVLALSLAAPSMATAQTAIAPSGNVIEAIGIAKDGLYVDSRAGGFGRLRLIPLGEDGSPIAGPLAIKMPFPGAVSGASTDPQEAGAIFSLTSWTHSPGIYWARPAVVIDTHLRPPSPVDMSAYTSSEVLARSGDGTMVPLSIVYRRGLKLDGSHPAYLEGYGSYGITLQPSFSATRVAWLERGAVFAVCHPRGSGWYGEAWHRAGMITTKPHTWEDFIACGEYLVQHGYTSKAHLAGEGTSAGGITIGRAITTRPDLFAAALDVVGVSNALRSEFTPNGPPNIPEFGTVKNETGFKALYAMDAYQHVVNGTAYPAVMLITGYNDPRVSSWELAKMTARLQQATTSKRPILLRVDYDAGHGFLAASRAQSEQLLTDEYSFLLWQCGDPAFAGIPTRIFRRS